MKTAMIMIALLAAPVLGLNVKSLEESSESSMSSLTFDEEGAKMSPVTKVVKLMKDMLHEMEKEEEEDEKAHEEMQCWCKTNDKLKTEAIAAAESAIEDLTTKIETLTALSAQTNTQLKHLEKEKAEDENTLAQATALRKKQLKEFNAEEKDMLQSIKSLSAALTILSKKSSSMIQVPLEVQNLVEKHSALLTGVITHSEQKTLKAFLQAPGYQSQGGEVIGILTQMKETFETNLANDQKEEASSVKTFEDLKAAKEEEIQTGQDQIDGKQKLLATTDEKLEQAKDDLVSTRKSKASDEDFLASLKERCRLNEDEFKTRTKERAEEVAAVNKGMAVLTDDDNNDLFTKTVSFVQKDSTMHSERRTEAAKVIEAVADKTKNPSLAQLAVSVRINAFGKVKKAIDEMVRAIGHQKADDVIKRDFCIESFQKNELTKVKKTKKKYEEVVEIKDLNADEVILLAQIKVLNDDIADLQKNLKREGENREKENKEFQITIQDQRATQRLLKSAMHALEGFYAKKAAAASLLEKKADPNLTAGSAPAGFKKHKKNDKAGGVMGMLKKIIADSRALEDEAIRDEQDSQKTYEEFVIKTNASLENKQAEVLQKTPIEVDDEQAELVDIRDKKKYIREMKALDKERADLHTDCDFTTKNFEIRQEGFEEEMDAMKQAKSILSGAKFEAFLSLEH